MNFLIQYPILERVLSHLRIQIIILSGVHCDNELDISYIPLCYNMVADMRSPTSITHSWVTLLVTIHDLCEEESS